MLDSQTKVGRQNILKQNWVLEYLKKEEGIDYIPTEKKNDVYDAEVFRAEKLIYLIEIKNRSYINRAAKEKATLKRLSELGTYLVSYSKLTDLRDRAKEKGCSSVLCVNLPHDNKIMMFEISNSIGDFLFEFKIEKTETFRSCNNFRGKVFRENAFLPINNNPFLKIYSYDS